MANQHYIVLRNLTDTTVGSYWSVWICDTYAGRPVTGLNVGDLGIMIDQDRLYVADSTTTWAGKAHVADITANSVNVIGGAADPTIYSSIASAATILRINTIPDTDGDFAMADAAQTLTNKTLSMGGDAVASLYSGTYTPTLTNVGNLAASTAYQCQYMRVGNIVTVSGRVDIDPTTSATATHLGISLPIASNLGALEDCAGTAHASAIAGQGAAICGDSVNNRAAMLWTSGDVTNQPMYFAFTYRVI